MSITEIHDRADNVIIHITEKSVVFMVEKILYEFMLFMKYAFIYIQSKRFLTNRTKTILF